jgi:hypothetical protein
MFDVLTTFGIDTTTIHPDYKPLIVPNKANTSAGWKLISSACHVEEPVCPCGTCYQDQHHDGMVTDDNACYHYNVVDDDELAIAHARTEETMNMLGANLDEITALSQVCLPRAGAFDIGKTKPHSINYKPPNSTSQNKYFRSLAEELELCDTSPV